MATQEAQSGSSGYPGFDGTQPNNNYLEGWALRKEQMGQVEALAHRLAHRDFDDFITSFQPTMREMALILQLSLYMPGASIRVFIETPGFLDKLSEYFKTHH